MKKLKSVDVIRNSADAKLLTKVGLKHIRGGNDGSKTRDDIVGRGHHGIPDL